MKRGFLNSPRYKQALEAAGGINGDQDTGNVPAAAVPSTGGFDSKAINTSLLDGRDPTTTPAPHGRDANPKEERKTKVIDVDTSLDSDNPFSCPLFVSDSAVIARPPPRRQGWGRDIREDVLHTVPRSHGGPDKKRCVFRMWPRDPKGKPILPSDPPKGTLSPDGYPWGATLYDFYVVNRIPGMQLVISYMTGSALLEEMEARGELDTAAPEIKWAKSEGKPVDEGVADTEELITCVENHIRMAAMLESSVNSQGGDGAEEKDGERGKGKGEEKREGDSEEDADEDEEDEDEEDSVYHGFNPPSLKIPVTSPFHPSHYPDPWPLTPFRNPEKSVLLQECIPLYLLPKNLYVHDPFNLLDARNHEFPEAQWSSRTDIVRTYKLQLSESVLKEVKQARNKAEELEEFKARTLIILRYKRTKEQIQNFEPMVEIPLPPYQRRPTKTEEGHLYISLAARIGEGHHSVVYKGEWELPRDLFVKPTLCSECFKESAHKEVQRLKDTGRWEKMLRAGAWGPTGFTGREPTRAELEEVSDAPKLEQNGEIIEREIICVVPPDMPPSSALHLINEYNVWKFFMENPKRNIALIDFVARLDKDGATDDSNVAVIRIDPPFSYESQKDCTHGPRAVPTPRTTKFTVIAKLSLEHDQHLATEANNYQQFPEHFFHHYDGYTIISQLRAIVPVHAIVPQFYGYYTPKADELKSWRYISPILLLEHCGQPIDPKTLSAEDQEECISMLLRFQRAGWLHESVAPRNLLVQKGKPTEFPLQRQIRPELSFRLIDFGWSRRYTNADEKRAEEMEVLRMFTKLLSQMAVTL